MIRILIAAIFLTTASTAVAKDDSDLIVLVLFDALRADHVSGWGYERPTSPHLDSIAKEGTSYRRAYVNAPWTRPSTTSFLTGYYASRHRNETERSKLPDSVLTLAERLKKEGYVTAGFTANGNGGSLARLEKGFDVFEDPSITYKKKMRGKTYCCNGLPTGEFITKRAIDWMNRSKAKKKFVFLFYVDPHDPYGAPPELEKMMLGPNFKGKIRRHALWEANNDYSKDERYSLLALYDAGIRYADQALNQFTDYLKKKGQYEDAHIIVSADHGEGFGEHGFYLHAHHFWQEVIHVPIIARGPRFKKNHTDNRLTHSIDVARTIAELAGASTAGMPGTSLYAPPAEDPLIISEYNEFGIHRQAIIGERYKVIWQRPADEKWYMARAKKREYFPSVSFDKDVVRVFDLVNDPKERKDLGSAMPAEAQQLLKRLKAFVAESERLAPSRMVAAP